MLVTVIVASMYSMREEAANSPLVLADQPDEPSSISSPSSLPSTGGRNRVCVFLPGSWLKIRRLV